MSSKVVIAVEHLEDRRLMSAVQPIAMQVLEAATPVGAVDAPLSVASTGAAASAASASASSTPIVGSLLPLPGTVQMALPIATDLNTNSKVDVVVTRLLGASGTVTVNYATSNATATAGVDYTAVSGTLTFADGEVAKTISVPLVDNPSGIAASTFNVTLSSPTGGALLGLVSTTVVTVQNLRSVVSVAQSTLNVQNTLSNATVTLTRTGNTLLPAIVHYTTGGGNAQPGVDYTAVEGLATFLPGQSTTTVLVPLLGNAAAAATSALNFTLDVAGEATVLGQTLSTTISLANPNTLVEMAQPAITAVTSAGQALVTVTRAGNTAISSTINYTTEAVSQNSAGVYTAVSGVLTFAPGELSKIVAIPLLQGALNAGSAVVDLVLSIPGVNTVLSQLKRTTVTIVDSPSTISTSSSSLQTNDDDAVAQVTVTRTGNTDLAVSVDYATADNTAYSGLHYNPVSGTLSFAAGETTKTITVPLLQHAAADALSFFNVVLSNVRGGAILSSQNTTLVGIANSDSHIQFSQAVFVATPNAGFASITVTRQGNTTTEAIVTYKTVDGTAHAGAEYTAAEGTLVFAAGETSKTILVSLTDAAHLPAVSEFAVALSQPGGNGVLGLSSATVQLANSRSLVKFQAVSIEVTEKTGLAVVTLHRTGNLSASATVDFATADDTAVGGVDFTSHSGTVTFAAGQSLATFEVAVTSDLVSEQKESILLHLSNATGNALLGDTVATLYVNDSNRPTKVTDVSLMNGTTRSADANGYFGKVAVWLDNNLQAAPATNDFTLYRRSKDRRAGGGLAKPVKLKSISYQGSDSSLAVEPVKPLKANCFYQLVAKPGTLKDAAGVEVDGAGNGTAGSPFSLYFGSGTKLRYVDSDGDAVTLTLKGKGVIELTRRSDGEGNVLTVTGADGTTSLVTTIKKGRLGDGKTTLGDVKGIDPAQLPAPVVLNKSQA